jgi:hypothetical protein
MNNSNDDYDNIIATAHLGWTICKQWPENVALYNREVRRLGAKRDGEAA